MGSGFLEMSGEKGKRHLKILQERRRFDLESSGDDLYSPSLPRSPRRMRRLFLRGKSKPALLFPVVGRRHSRLVALRLTRPLSVRYQPKASLRRLCDLHHDTTC